MGSEHSDQREIKRLGFTYSFFFPTVYFFSFFAHLIRLDTSCCAISSPVVEWDRKDSNIASSVGGMGVALSANNNKSRIILRTRLFQTKIEHNKNMLYAYSDSASFCFFILSEADQSRELPPVTRKEMAVTYLLVPLRLIPHDVLLPRQTWCQRQYLVLRTLHSSYGWFFCGSASEFPQLLTIQDTLPSSRKARSTQVFEKYRKICLWEIKHFLAKKGFTTFRNLPALYTLR